jgi:hypothetical protein
VTVELTAHHEGIAIAVVTPDCTLVTMAPGERDPRQHRVPDPRAASATTSAWIPVATACRGRHASSARFPNEGSHEATRSMHAPAVRNVRATVCHRLQSGFGPRVRDQNRTRSAAPVTPLPSAQSTTFFCELTSRAAQRAWAARPARAAAA